MICDGGLEWDVLETMFVIGGTRMELDAINPQLAARLARGDSAADWVPQLSEHARRVRVIFAAADADTRDALRDCLAETAEVVRLAATCGDEWLSAHRSAVAADVCAARLRRAYGLDAELLPSP